MQTKRNERVCGQGIDPETDLCRGCGVLYGDPCEVCGEAGYHVSTCAALDGLPDDTPYVGYSGIGTAYPKPPNEDDILAAGRRARDKAKG